MDRAELVCIPAAPAEKAQPQLLRFYEMRGTLQEPAVGIDRCAVCRMGAWAVLRAGSRVGPEPEQGVDPTDDSAARFSGNAGAAPRPRLWSAAGWRTLAAGPFFVVFGLKNSCLDEIGVPIQIFLLHLPEFLIEKGWHTIY